MYRIHLLILIAIFASNPLQSAEMIPFELPWDDDSESTLGNRNYTLPSPGFTNLYTAAATSPPLRV